MTPRDARSYTEPIGGRGRGVKLGLNTYSYRCAAGLWDYTPRENAAMGLDHFLRKAAEMNLDGLHLADARHLDSLEYGHVSEVRQKADALGLYLELGTAGTNPDHLENMVRAAHVLGSTVVCTFVGKPRPTSAQEMEQIVSAAAAEIRQVLPVCERYGIGLALENNQDLTTEELLTLLEQIDSRWVGVCFDTGNPLAVLEDPLESARAVASLVKTIHLKDYQLAARPDGFSLLECALGEGVVDLRGIVDLVRSEAPQATLNIETSAGTHPMPVLEEAYLERFPETPVVALGRTLRLVRDRGVRREPGLGMAEGESEEELLAAEDELVVRSVRWAEAALGRADSGEERFGG